MNTLLQLNTSIQSEQGESSRLAARLAARWREAHPGGRVVVRDLARDPVPHLSAERFAAFLAQPGERDPRQRAIVAASDALIAELRAAETVIIGLPFYNFAVPSTLKAYIDHIARAGVTFRYTAQGPVGLLTGKQVYVAAARGGVHAGTASDTQSAYLRQILAFLGMTEVEFVYAEGLALGAAEKTAALARANAAIDAIGTRVWRKAA